MSRLGLGSWGLVVGGVPYIPTTTSQTLLFGCAQTVFSLGIGSGVASNLYPQKLVAEILDGYKWGALATLKHGIYHHLYTAKNTLSESVNGLFVHTFHKTYKGNYEIYKLITVISAEDNL